MGSPALGTLSHLISSKSSRASTGQASSCFTFPLVLSGSANHTRENEIFTLYSAIQTPDTIIATCVSLTRALKVCHAWKLPLGCSFPSLECRSPGSLCTFLQLHTKELYVLCTWMLLLVLVVCTCMLAPSERVCRGEYTRSSYHWHAPPHRYESSSAWSEFGRLLIRCFLAYGLSPLKNRTLKKI